MRGSIGARHICPSCFRRSGAWVLGGRTCPFCSTTMKPMAQVVGPDFEVRFKEMCARTQTGNWRQYAAELRRAARNGMGKAASVTEPDMLLVSPTPARAANAARVGRLA